MTASKSPVENGTFSTGKNRKTESEPSPLCSYISRESLSAFADGEYILTAEEKSHLENCVCCQKELDQIRKLSCILHKSLQKECPAELVDIMAEKVRERIKREKKSARKRSLHFSFRHFLLHAGFLVLLFILAAYLLVDNPNEEVFLPQENTDTRHEEKITFPYSISLHCTEKELPEIEKILAETAGTPALLRESPLPTVVLTLTEKQLTLLISRLAEKGINTDQLELFRQNNRIKDQKTPLKISFNTTK